MRNFLLTAVFLLASLLPFQCLFAESVPDGYLYFSYKELEFCEESFCYFLKNGKGETELTLQVNSPAERNLRRAFYDNMIIGCDLKTECFRVFNLYTGEEYDLDTLPDVPYYLQFSAYDITLGEDMSYYYDSYGRDFPIPMDIHNRTILNASFSPDIVLMYSTESGLLEMWEKRQLLSYLQQ